VDRVHVGRPLSLDNYAYVDRNGLGRAFLNSLIISIPCTVLLVTVAGVRGLRLRLDAVPRPRLAVHRGLWRSSRCRCRSR
jgi:hypothetical protein